MVRHISILTFLEQSPDGTPKQENVEAVRRFLEKIPSQFPAIRQQQVYAPINENPFLPENAPVMFGDLIQIADFDTAEDAERYPASQAHADLSAFSSRMLRKVTVIDFEI